MDGIYPVIEEISLAPLARHRLRSPWRDPATLPRPRPGAVYVFEYAGRYQPPFARLVHGGEPHVVEATAVALVQTRDWPISVRRSIPSHRPGTNLIVDATFRCCVTDPVAVAAAGPVDLATVLATHVAADRELATLGRHVHPDRAGEAVLRIEAQLRAYCTVNPPEIVGVSAVLGAVEVRPEPHPAGAVPATMSLAPAAETVVASVPAPVGSIVTTEIRRDLRDEVVTFAQERFGRRPAESPAGPVAAGEDAHAR